MFVVCFCDILWFSLQVSTALEVFLVFRQHVAPTSPLKNPELKVDCAFLCSEI